MLTPDLLDELWREQSRWSRTADRMKQRIERARVVALIVMVAAAVFGTVAGVLAEPQPVASRVLAGLAAFGAALLPLLRPAWTGKALRDWTRARSVSEALKSEVYLWLARVGDYHDDEPAISLRKKTDRIRDDAADLLRYQIGIEAKQRMLPDVHDVPSYFAVRVTDQIGKYYRPKAEWLAKRLRWFRHIEAALAVVGAALGATAAVTHASLARWIAVVTTVSAAVAVHVAATRYEYQLIEFLRTAERLTQLKNVVDASASSDKLESLAVAAESVISVENQGWMAKLVEDPPDYKPMSGS